MGSVRNLGSGLLFAALWASAAVATKLGISSAPPLVMANLRFFTAGILLLLYTLIIRRKVYRWPRKSEWIQLSIFGFLNTTLYLGLYVVSLKYTAAGIGSLAISINPLLIVLISALLIGRIRRKNEMYSILIGMSGIIIAAYPLLRNSNSSISGLLLLLMSMTAASGASIYYTRINWKLPATLINGWQVTLGGFFLLPFTLFWSDLNAFVPDTRFILSTLWLSIAVSVVGLFFWFHLLKTDAVRASLWLFLCPIFGFVYAWWFLKEPITLFTIGGTLLVILALYLGQRPDKR